MQLSAERRARSANGRGRAHGRTRPGVRSLGGGSRPRGAGAPLVAWALAGASAAAALAMPALARAEIDEQSAGYLFHYFADSDHVHVYSNYGQYQVGWANGADVAVQWNREIVVVPGVDAPPGTAEADDAITSASRPVSSRFSAFEEFTKVRNEIQADVTARKVRAGYYVSKETDYLGQQVSGSVNRDLGGGNTNVAVGTSYGWDAIAPLEDDDTEGGDESKTTLHWNAVATQTLTPTTTVRVGGEWNVVRGLQHNPYRNVYAGGSNIAERHPDRRVRRDVFIKVNQYLKNRSSIKGDYKYYADDWGVASHTLGVKLSQYVTGDVVVGYGYRFYDQSAAVFYRDEYVEADGIDGYRTGDYRLGDFSAHLFGTNVDWTIGRLGKRVEFLGPIRLSMKYERYFNSNNFSANIFEGGFGLSF